MGDSQNNILLDRELMKLKKINSERRNGFLVLLDVKDSTIRKIHYGEKWAIQTGILYSAFRRYFQSLATQIGAEQTVIKFIGDGLLVFYPGTIGKEKNKNQECDAKLSEFLIEKTLEFVNMVHEQDEFCGLKLKSVLAYLTGIQLINTGRGGEIDVLGRGIDFAFRLEKFADTTHIVLNEMFAKAYTKAIEKSKSSTSKKFELIWCRRKMRGWEDPKGESFCLLTGEQMIAANITAIIPSVHSDNVINELFSFYVKTMYEKKSSEANQELMKKFIDLILGRTLKGEGNEL